MICIYKAQCNVAVVDFKMDSDGGISHIIDKFETLTAAKCLGI